jgi:tetrahydromethanopterin S-methyltransferase subunit A
MMAVRGPRPEGIMSTTRPHRRRALELVRKQIPESIRAKKCHPCGCLHDTVAALAVTDLGRTGLAPLLAEVGRALRPRQYDCLGCAVCYPAVAANALADAYPDAAVGLAACPTEPPGERAGWPPLPGDYHVVRWAAPVAVCTLNSADLAGRLAARRPSGLGIVGTLHTENLGIERIIRNVLANPHLRFLVVCGEDTRQAIGHLAGQSLASLCANGTDERGRIREAPGTRAILQNVTPDQVGAFRRQVQLVDLIGEQEEETILRAIVTSEARDPGALAEPVGEPAIPIVRAREPARLNPDPAGFFVVYPDARRERLVVEHYTVAAVLDCVIEGTSPAAIAAEAIERGLLTRLDHAVYLGRELTRAERSLTSAEQYVQDRAPGQPEPATPEACECGTDSATACE